MYMDVQTSNVFEIIQYPYISAQTHEDLAVWSQGLQSDNITRMYQSRMSGKGGNEKTPFKIGTR